MIDRRKANEVAIQLARERMQAEATLRRSLDPMYMGDESWEIDLTKLGEVKHAHEEGHRVVDHSPSRHSEADEIKKGELLDADAYALSIGSALLKGRRVEVPVWLREAFEKSYVRAGQIVFADSLAK